MSEAADFIRNACQTWLLHNWPIVLLFIGFAVLWSVDRGLDPSADPDEGGMKLKRRKPTRMRD